MRLAQAFATVASSDTARTLGNTLRDAVDVNPDWVIGFHTGSVAAELAQEALTVAFPDAAIQGCSSSRSIFGGAGMISDPAIGILALADPLGAFGTGSATFTDHDPRVAASLAIRQAIDAAHRQGSLPDFVWLCAVPGCEEAVIAGIEQVIGASVPIVGGSAAVNGLSGRCVTFDRSTVVDDGLVLTAAFLTGQAHHGFFGGYRTTAQSGVVTAAAERCIIEIDGQPAAAVYNRWTEGLIAEELACDGNVVEKTTMMPIGMTVGHVGTAPVHVLLHPIKADDGALWVHGLVPAGSQLTLMVGDQNILVTRTAELVERTQALFNVPASRVSGGLLVYCAGCARPLAQRCGDMVDLAKGAFRGTPFLGGFFFGEQGRFWRNRNTHANLMLSLLLFEDAGPPSLAAGQADLKPPTLHNELPLAYEILKTQLQETRKTDALLRVGLNKIVQVRSHTEIFEVLCAALREVIDFDHFIVIRQTEGCLVCTSSSDEQVSGKVWHCDGIEVRCSVEKPMLIGDARQSPHWLQNPDFYDILRPGSAIHLGFLAENVPLLFILTHPAINGFGLPDRDVLYVLSPFIRQAVENVINLRRLETLATTDCLTGINNRRRFLELAAAEIARSYRFGHPSSVLMIDADHFKTVNDSYGHDNGDAALRHMVAIIGSELRSVDILGRLGGEEFAVVIAQADAEAAFGVADRIRSKIESSPVIQSGCCFGMTVSIGVATSRASTDSVARLLMAADQALYAAKHAGRNRVMCSSTLEANQG